MKDGPAAIMVLIIAVVVLSNIRSCGGGGAGRSTYGHGRDAGHLQSENVQLQEANRQAAARLEVERRRAAHLVEEIGIRRHVESIVVGVVVLSGCALAATFFALMRQRRAQP
ncbi:MAG: hypothetical protein O2923_10805 [Verrucomicrobia bacterium]|nr:hypothetical protein [Verrucomicrobiota bacterium]MDA1257852.1 hypothetical protein [Chloroflexota bacterium]